MNPMNPGCRWYLLCDNAADGVVAHPILEYVPTCKRCAAKHDLDLIEGDFGGEGMLIDFTAKATS